MLLNPRSLLPLFFGISLFSVGVAAFELPPKTKGKYCDTPSRCLNPMTQQGMVTSPNYLATQADIDVLRRGGNAVFMVPPYLHFLRYSPN